MEYPLKLSFKLLALTTQLTVKDANGAVICSLKRKFSLKDKITIFADEAQTHPLYYIEVDKILTTAPRYHFTYEGGKSFGSVKCNGWRSLWNIDYEICPPDSEVPTLRIDEENPWVKVADAVLSEIPFLGLATSFLFHPSYAVKNGETKVMRIKKEASMFESRFKIERLEPLSEEDETRSLLSMMIMIMAARQRG